MRSEKIPGLARHFLEDYDRHRSREYEELYRIEAKLREFERESWNHAIDEAGTVVATLAKQAKAAGDDGGRSVLENAADEVNALRRD